MILIIYLIGIPISYIMIRRDISKEMKWTVRLRQFAILISFLSWVTVLAAIGMMWERSIANNDTPAKW